MKYRLAVTVPLAVVVALWVTTAAVGNAATMGWFFRVSIPILFFISFGLCLRAAFRFERQDYMWKAWVLAGTAPLALAISGINNGLLALLEIPVDKGFNLPNTVRLVLLVVANTAMPLSVWMFGRAVEVAGLTMLGSPKGRMVAALVAAVIAVSLAGPTLVDDLRTVSNGSYRHVANLYSDVGDMAVLILIAPLLFTAWTLRGGAIAWPFGLVALATLNWLMFDLALTFSPALGLSDLWKRTFEETFRTLAILYLPMGALTQCWVLSLDDKDRP